MFMVEFQNSDSEAQLVMLTSVNTTFELCCITLGFGNYFVDLCIFVTDIFFHAFPLVTKHKQKIQIVERDLT